MIPKSSTNIGDIKKNQDEIFLLINNSEKHIIVFSTQINLKYLSECDVLYVYGAFKSCLKRFYQLFIIHEGKNSNYTLSNFRNFSVSSRYIKAVIYT